MFQLDDTALDSGTEILNGGALPDGGGAIVSSDPIEPAPVVTSPYDPPAAEPFIPSPLYPPASVPASAVPTIPYTDPAPALPVLLSPPTAAPPPPVPPIGELDPLSTGLDASLAPQSNAVTSNGGGVQQVTTAQLFAGDPLRPGAGYVMWNGKPYRVEGTTKAGLNPDGSPRAIEGAQYILDAGDGNVLVGPAVDVNDYNAWVNGVHKPDADPTQGSRPGDTTARTMVNGVVVLGDGKPGPTQYQQQVTIGGVTAPYVDPDNGRLTPITDTTHAAATDRTVNAADGGAQQLAPAPAAGGAGKTVLLLAALAALGLLAVHHGN